MNLIILSLILSLVPSLSFYLPGVAPHDYEFAETIKVKVDVLDSIETQLPYDYYSLPFCRPSEGVKRDAENLGEILTGESIENSPYKVSMNNAEQCKLLCRRKYNKNELKVFKHAIEEQYRVNLIIDNLPAAQKFKTVISDGEKTTEDYIYEKGYPLGFVANSVGESIVYLNNHVDLIILYHNDEEHYSGGRVVGFEVQPKSIKHQTSDTWDETEPEKNSIQCTTETLRIATPDLPKQLDIIWSYSVAFEPSNIKWASRWDAYLKMQDPQIHWFSILNSFMIVLFLTGMVGITLLRALRKDLMRYTENNDPESQKEETGWKLVHGDVFRTPSNPSLFSTIIGTGVQVIAMCFLTLIFAALGFLSPANRGSLMTTLLLLYVFMSIFAGYYSVRTYKMFGETDWQKQTLQTACLFPGINFLIFFLLNLFIWHAGSSGAVPFGTMFALLVLWFGISVPLVYLGAYFGYKKDIPKFPCRTNEIERFIPPQPWYMQKYFAILVGGILPFGAVFIEVFFIMSSVWLHHYYYMFGFLLLVFVILIVTSAEITILMVYFQLCAEDHKWWWRSILTSGSSAFYLFGYSILYYYTKLDIMPFTSTMLYFGYMLQVTIAFFLLTGTVGYFATLTFIQKIYGAIKIS